MPPPPPPAAKKAPQGNPPSTAPTPRPALGLGEWEVRAVTQGRGEDGWYHLRGHAELENTARLFRADEIDWNEDSGDVQARGNVYFEDFVRHEKLWCDRLEYNTEEETGKFFNVRGSGQPRIDARPGVLTSTEPYYFQGQWAERLGEKYVLHNGFITNCKMPRPWWRLKGPRFDIVPDDRAIAYRSVFLLRGFPLFYTPFFYKSLQRVPRKSGFLMPNLGNSSVRGKMIGVGYYWAINRSYDAIYHLQDFTERGLAHHVELRGKPRAGTDFDAIIYGVQDKLGYGGLNVSMTGKSDLGHGWYARADVNYLSSLLFRLNYSETFNEAIFSEVHSVGFVDKSWDTFTFNSVFARLENFQSATAGDSITIRKLPELDFSSRDHRIWQNLPLWFSFDSSAGLLGRSQPAEPNHPAFDTGRFVDRLDFQPEATAAFHWKGIDLVPSLSFRETHYGESQVNGKMVPQDYLRSAREASLDLVLPSLERVFNHKTFLGDKLKHVIEPRVEYHYVTGINDFNRALRFDENDLFTNTNEADISITNRLYAKKGNEVNEVLTWELRQARYFDPTFGGAVQPGQVNVIWTQIMLTPYTFLDHPRSASPIVSNLRLSPRPGFGVSWQSDYDHSRGGITDSTVTADGRVSQYFMSVGYTQTRCLTAVPGAPCNDPNTVRLLPPANQIRGTLGFGNNNRRGFNAGFTAIYDYRVGLLEYAVTQVTYNTDCCGLSVQFGRISLPGAIRNENQFRVAFSVANIGSFGTLKKQERLF